MELDFSDTRRRPTLIYTLTTKCQPDRVFTMKTPIRLYLLAVLALLCIGITDGKTSFADGKETMDVDEIVPGMKGYGKTVFNGTQIETFQVEVLGVLKNWDVKSNMILIRMSGGPLEQSGIISGMSGSPVYIDNRLIGAVAYGWNFAKEPIAGVTPILEMKNSLLNVPPPEKEASPTSIDWEIPPAQQNSMELRPQDSFLQPQVTEDRSLNNIKLTPIMSPMFVSGIDSDVLQNLQPLFTGHGLYPIQGGSAISSASAGTARLAPGASMAAILIRGDFNAAVVGTVTYTENGHVMGFGHPFLHTGSTDLPLASAYVYAILSSQSNSIKMASPLEVIGRITQDRKSGVAGVLGESSRMTPCHVEVEGSQKLNYDFEIVNNKQLTPSLLLMVMQSAVLSTERKSGEKSVRITLSVHIDGYDKPVVIENIFYDMDQSWLSINHIIQAFAMITNNQFQKVGLKQIDVKIKILDSRQTAYIEAIRVDKKSVKPGDTLQVDVQLKPFTGESMYQTASILIPEDVPPGSILSVTACDSTYGQSLNMSRAAGKHLPTNFEQLLRYVENMERNNRLQVRVLLPKKGLTYKGEGFPSLPPSMQSIMSVSNQSGIGPLFDEEIVRVPTRYVIMGNQSVSVVVK